MKRGFICGAWDLLHPGHAITLRDCREKCDYLVVGLQVDPSLERPEKNKPVQSVLERWIQLKCCKYVDQIIPYETNEDLLNLLKTGNFDVRFLGTDYLTAGMKIIGKHIVPITYIPRTHSYSSTELRKRVKNS